MSWSLKRPSRPGLYWWRFQERRGMASLYAIKRASVWFDGGIPYMVLHGLTPNGEMQSEPFHEDEWNDVEWFGEPVSAPLEAVDAPV